MLFPDFDVTFTNLNNGNLTTNYIASCNYNPKTSPFCPIFTLGSIAKMAGINNFQSVVAAGSILAVQLDWTCDLDKSSTACVPTWEFSRLDDPNSTVCVTWLTMHFEHLVVVMMAAVFMVVDQHWIQLPHRRLHGHQRHESV